MSDIKVNTQMLGLKDLNLHVEDSGGHPPIADCARYDQLRNTYAAA